MILHTFRSLTFPSSFDEIWLLDMCYSVCLLVVLCQNLSPVCYCSCVDICNYKIIQESIVLYCIFIADTAVKTAAV